MKYDTVGTHELTYTATDGCNNSVSDTRIIRVLGDVFIKGNVTLNTSSADIGSPETEIKQGDTLQLFLTNGAITVNGQVAYIAPTYKFVAPVQQSGMYPLTRTATFSINVGGNLCYITFVFDYSKNTVSGYVSGKATLLSGDMVIKYI